MTSSVAFCPISSAVVGTHGAQHSGQASILEAQQAIAAALPELIERAMREPYFRDSLLQDTRLTIESVLSARAGARVELPEFMRIVAVENTPDTVNLVIPVAHEGMRVESAGTSLASAILIKASRDEALLADLLSNPRETLARELSRSNGTAIEIDSALNFAVHTPSPHEVMIVVPETTPDRVPTPRSINAELNAVEMATTSGLNDTKEVAFYTSTAFTYCGVQCSGVVCASAKPYC